MKRRNALWVLCFAALPLSAPDSAVLVPLAREWKAENAVVATESFRYMRALEPSLRLELLRRGVSDDRAEELLRTFAMRNAAPVSIESPALAGLTRSSVAELFRRSIARDPTLAKNGPLRVISVPAVARDAAIELVSDGENTSLTYLTKAGDGWRIAWTKHFGRKELHFVSDPDVIPHRAVLSSDDVGVIDALIDAMHVQTLVNATTINDGFTPHDAFDDLRAANRQRTPVPLFLGAVTLGHRVAMTDFDPRNRSMLAVTLPGYSADHRRALMAYMTTLGVVMGGEAIFEKRGGQWVYVRDVGDALWQHPPNPADLPMRVGPDVIPPRVLKRVEPQFPPGTPKRVHIVEVTVGTDGRVVDVRLLNDPPGAVADAIAAAVRQWEFAPGTLNGKPVKVLHNVTISVP